VILPHWKRDRVGSWKRPCTVGSRDVRPEMVAFGEEEAWMRFESKLEPEKDEHKLGKLQTALRSFAESPAPAHH